MTDRIEALGGTLVVRSDAGRGYVGGRPDPGAGDGVGAVGMSARIARRLAVALAVLYVIVEGIGLALVFVTRIRPQDTFGFPGEVLAGSTFLAWPSSAR